MKHYRSTIFERADSLLMRVLVIEWHWNDEEEAAQTKSSQLLHFLHSKNSENISLV